MSELSAKWKIKPLDELLDVQNGYAFNSKQFSSTDGMPLVRIRDINNGTNTQTNYIGDYDKKYVIRKGDLLIGMDGEFRCSQWNGPDALLNQRVCRLQEFSDNILPRFLFYGINKYLKEIEDATTFTTVKHLSSRTIKEIRFPIPPIPIQNLIVAILGEAFSSISQAVANTEKNLANASELFESYLNNVFTQKGDGWVEYQLLDLTTKIGSGATPKGGERSYKSEGITLIRSLNVYDRWFTDRKLAFIDNEQANKLSNVIVEKGDVLFNITGASVARCCIAPDVYLPARVNQHVSIIRPKQERVSTDFLCYLMTSRFYKDVLLGIGYEGGSTRQAITKKQLQDLVIFIPESKEEQMMVVNRLNELSSKTQQLETIYQQKLTALTELKQSILQNAFTGELTANAAKQKVPA